jgi:hypothetical protein
MHTQYQYNTVKTGDDFSVTGAYRGGGGDTKRDVEDVACNDVVCIRF